MPEPPLYNLFTLQGQSTLILPDSSFTEQKIRNASGRAESNKYYFSRLRELKHNL